MAQNGFRVLDSDMHCMDNKRKILWDNCARYYGITRG